MRKLAVVAASAALLSAAFLLGRVAAPAPAGATAGPPQRQVLHYACPMHPTVRSDRPGTAPCCGMALEPVYQDGAGAGAAAEPVGTVAIGEGLRQLQGVKVAAVERTATTQQLRLFGQVVPDETRVYSLNAALEGSIQDLAGVTTGSFVKRGQRLGAFFSADIRTPLQAYITALDVIALAPAGRVAAGLTIAAGSTADRNAQYVVERLRSLGMSQRQLEEVQRSRVIPLSIDIRAPADGLVLARNVSPGQKFAMGTEWFRIADLSKVWIHADLLEGDAPLVRPGATARVTVPGRPEALTAVVSQVPPQYDATSRTMKVRLELDNPGALLRPDMYVDVELAVERAPAVVIPADALIDSGLRRTVFVALGEGRYAPRAVETGWRFGDRVEIVAGLSAGERIVTSGTFLVDSESQLRAAAAAPPPAAATPASAAAPGSARDPVCGMEVDVARAAAAGRTADHHGRHFAFCSDGCKARFAAAPDTFAEGGEPAHHHPALQAAAEARP